MISGNSTSSQDRSPTRWLSRARTAWYVAAFLSLVVVIITIPNYIRAVPNGFGVIEFAANPSPAVLVINVLTALISFAAMILCLYLALLLFHRRSDDRMALFLSFYLLVFGFYCGPNNLLTAKEPFSLIGKVWNSIFTPLIMYPASCFLFLLFPDGRFAPDWSRRLALAALVTAPVGTIANLIWFRSQSDALPVLIISSILTVVVVSCVLYAQFYRYRHIASRQQRQQIKWVLYGLGIMLFLLVATALPYFWSFTLPASTPYPLWLAITTAIYLLSFAVFPVSLTIAVLRYRLYDIDILINRTLVYGALTVGVVSLYVVVVAAMSLVFQSNSKLAGVLLTTALVVALFRPLRAQLQRSVDRLLPTDPPAVREQEQTHPQTPVALRKPDRSKRGEWGRILRPLWLLLAAGSVFILIASLPGYLKRVPIGNLGTQLVFEPTPLLRNLNDFNSLLSFLSAVLSVCLAGFLFVKKSRERMGLFLSFYLLAHGILLAGPIEMLEPIWPNIARLNSFLFLPVFLGPLTVALISIFPDGHFQPRWAGWLIPASLLTLTAGNLMERDWLTTSLATLGWGLNALLIVASVAFICTLLYVPIYRYRFISTPEQRQQTKWVIYGFILWFFLLVLSSVPWMAALSLPPGSSIPWWLLVAQFFWLISTTIFPVTLTIAVMRFRLFEIDLLINRTLVYGTLTAGVVVAYALVVGGLGILFQTQSSLLVAFLATGLVAVLFQPVRERLQRAVNRMMYGERDDPATVFARLGNLLEASTNPQEILPGLVRTIAQTLKLPYTAIEIGKEEDREVAAAYGKPTVELERFALVYQLEDVGNLVVSPRSEGEELTLADRRLLENIAHQAGTVTHAVRLTNELQRSRLRLVTAREEERRRLRRDLHDELGPRLASQTLIIEALEKRLRKDPASAARLLEELKKQSRRAMQDIRQIIYGLRPPALDQLGLVGAIKEALAAHQRSGVSFHLQAKEKMPPLPAAVEVAIYHIVQEAVTNVIRHAKAKRCIVRIVYEELEEDAEVRLTVEDDGIGLQDDRRNGVGIHSMRERADELGGDFKVIVKPEGGTQISVRLPITQAAA
jgi:signal transduction histidine kinase